MRIVIAEDQVLLREGLRRLFEDAGHDVTATVDAADRLRGAVSGDEPDLAVVDEQLAAVLLGDRLQALDFMG